MQSKFGVSFSEWNVRWGRWWNRVFGLMLVAALAPAWGQQSEAAAPPSNPDNCFVREVKTLPGSHGFAADFIEVIATDPAAKAKDRDAIWALNADLHSDIPKEERALYISKSTDGGETWTLVAQMDSRYFDSDIDEGLRNGLEALPGGNEFVVTTQKGAFQVLPQAGGEPVVKYIAGPRVP
ncbi:MAG TPA: hypothetical protein VK670_00940, partial [Silvibacterium sp.]|nr:hypothetical protein [Silvibacterium sp.]